MINLNLVQFITKTNQIKGVSFAGLNNYVSTTTGEISNFKVNLGATLHSAKAKDLETLKELNLLNFFHDVVKPLNNPLFNADILTKAYENVYNSLVAIGGKQLNGTIKEKSNRSYGQTNAYTIINNSVKVHNEKERLYLYGLVTSKTVLVKGEYKTVNSRPLTKMQNLLKKGMKSQQFRTFIVESADVMNLAKTQFKGENLEINL